MDKRAKTQLIHVHITRNQTKRFLLAFHGLSRICTTMIKAKNIWSGNHNLGLLKWFPFIFIAESFSREFMKTPLQIFLKLGTHEDNNRNYKNREPFWIKTSRIQENQLYVKMSMTSLHCHGKPNCNKAQCSWDLNLFNSSKGVTDDRPVLFLTVV